MLMMSAVAVAPKVTFGPPVNAHRSGVSSVKCPVTVTVTRLAGSAPLAQLGVQLIATSAGAIVTNEPERLVRGGARHPVGCRVAGRTASSTTSGSVPPPSRRRAPNR